jgi:2-hydroxychromene-2-carboxylate isomerase
MSDDSTASDDSSVGDDSAMSDDVTFWFDPSCPYTWRTSRWLLAVTAARNLLIDWRLMSLAILNEDKDVPSRFRATQAGGRRAARVLIAVDEKYDSYAVERLYTEIGTRVHEDGRDMDERVLTEALAAAGLSADLYFAIEDDKMDEYLVESHYEGQDRVGTEAGSPIIALGDGPGFFGPIVVPIPEGEAAEKLFDAVRLLSAVPEFSELKRARQHG